ncbi:hypothetical protein [Lysinibacillus sp. NPDC056185]|uniref:hypothetical protein n=1 Tax=Lysinibacillus sp. NPDC056185 TaxID=3345739 RepID=UPI0039F06F6E
MTTKFFVKVQNRLITEDTESHLSVNGLYLYVLINSQLNINKTFSTNRDVLIQQLEGIYGSKRSTIVAKLNGALEEILEKSPLIVDNLDWKNSSSKDLLTFRMPENRENHTQVPYEVIASINDVVMLYIYVCVARWANKDKGFFKCPYVRWAKLLQCSERTAKSKIKEAVSQKVIFVNRGNYIEGVSKQQDINEYHIRSIAQKDKTIASIGYERAENSKNIEGIMGYDTTPLAERKGFLEYAAHVEIAIRAFENMDKSFYPSDEHYHTLAIAQRRNKTHLLAPEEQKLLEVALRRIKILSTNEKLKAIVQEKVERAKYKVSQLSKTDILFVTFQDKTKKKSPKNHSNMNSFEKTVLEDDDPFGED